MRNLFADLAISRQSLRAIQEYKWAKTMSKAPKSIDKALNIAELRELAKRRLPRMIFDYIDGGADDEIALRTNTSRFADYQLVWDALVDVTEIDTSTRIMGEDVSLPFFFAPTAASRMFHPKDGERAVANVARKEGMMYSISTLGSISIEEIAKVNPGPKLFQIYVWKNRNLVKNILERVREAGFTGIVLTVDLSMHGNRERDPRNGFSIPMEYTPQTLGQLITRPGYLVDAATSPKITPANFPDINEWIEDKSTSLMDFVETQFDRSITWDYVEWLKEVWDGPLAIKGISHAEDAHRAIRAGADTIWLSNHGGRQLETSRPTIDTLPEIRSAIGSRPEIILDSGIRRGTDIVKALALGANSVAVGRAYLYGLAAGGEAGVAKAVDILKTELERNLGLMGCPKVTDLTERFVKKP